MDIPPPPPAAAVSAMPGHLIRRLHQRSTQVFAEAMAARGEDLTPVQFAMLDALAATAASGGGGLDQASLARAVAKDRATVGAVVERLERKALVARSASDRDRRAIEVTLTPEGAALHARLLPVVAALQDAILAGLDPAERAAFVALAARSVAAD